MTLPIETRRMGTGRQGDRDATPIRHGRSCWTRNRTPRDGWPRPNRRRREPSRGKTWPRSYGSASRAWLATRAANRGPRSGGWPRGRAIAWASWPAGRTEEAVADYNRAIAQLPEDAELRMMRGHAMHRLGRYQPAIDDLDRAIELAPEDPDAYTHRGNVRAELRDFDRAIDDLQQALSLDEEFSDAYRSLAWLLATCPDPRFRDPQQALVAAQRAAQLAPPGDPFVYEALAAAHANAGRFDEAVRFQQEAIAIAPNDLPAHHAPRLSEPFEKGGDANDGRPPHVDGEVRAA